MNVEEFFSRFKEKTKRFWNRFPYRILLILCRVG